MGHMENKIAVVTGATSGIGEAVALMYAKEGADIVAVGRNEKKGQEVVDKITAMGREAIFVRCDLRKKEDICALKKAAMDKFQRVDVLFNAAGVLVHKPFLEQNDEDFNLIMETNYRAYVWMMQAFIPEMEKAGKGSVINVASISSIWPELNSYFYGAMKAAVTNISRNVAKEYAKKGIRINCILPGPINTNMTPADVKNNKEVQQEMINTVCMLGRLGVPDDIAYAAVYLGSDESSFVTATEMVVDGGVCISN